MKTYTDCELARKEAEQRAKRTKSLYSVCFRCWDGNKRIREWVVVKVSSWYIERGFYENEVALYGGKGKIR